MIIKVKCWNNEMKMWDECAFPIFKGMNPCEIIGFQDVDGSDKLIEDGHDVVLFSGESDMNDVEIYTEDIIECYREELAVVKFKCGTFGLETITYGFQPLHEVGGKMKVVGNTKENSNLLK